MLSTIRFTNVKAQLNWNRQGYIIGSSNSKMDELVNEYADGADNRPVGEIGKWWR